MSQYAREWVQTEVEICKRFEEGLNKDIKLLIEILEIREFSMLAGRAKKAEGLNIEKKLAEKETRVSSKRFMSKSQPYASKKSRSYHQHFTSSVGHTGKERSSKRSKSRNSSPSAASVGSVGNPKPWCNVCNKLHYGECRMKSEACFRCGSLDHFLKEFPEKAEKDTEQPPISSNLTLRGRPPRHPV
ncbi:uncharacterized protein LOC108468781 [Gossypium arboreum]|uniref:uncharacterized protein LOC108468781 n=1 Tax=Gossypium arboreum TaxID=29729 RepID=UPI0008194B68|nr:uncharacterized protein LOC108468781 [Gossypium arboreum]